MIYVILQHALGQCMFVCIYVYLSVTLLYACADRGARRRGMHVYESRSGRLDACGATPSLQCERLSYARLEGGGHDDQPACRGSQNNSDKQGEGGEAETSCAGLHARPKDCAFQNQCAHLDSMLFTARGISVPFAYTSIELLFCMKQLCLNV